MDLFLLYSYLYTDVYLSNLKNIKMSLKILVLSNID